MAIDEETVVSIVLMINNTVNRPPEKLNAVKKMFRFHAFPRNILYTVLLTYPATTPIKTNKIIKAVTRLPWFAGERKPSTEKNNTRMDIDNT